MVGKDKTIELARRHIKNLYLEEGTGHDYYHVERVVNNALKIVEGEEDCDEYLVELSAWLHDLGDYKLNEGEDRSEKLIVDFLNTLELDQSIIDKVVKIVSEVSFSKSKKPSSKEAMIVQDADRLDAIGAIGIARCFAYGGSIQNVIYSPCAQQNQPSTSIQHFYDKLLKIRSLMNTELGSKMANEKHIYMEEFLKQFYKEVSI